ncbi:hypothetical protein PINS_up000781 [Pythium insidiosum]|nr:hypothetical protein PINS_up000781 [Pythium insidiosum]
MSSIDSALQFGDEVLGKICQGVLAVVPSGHAILDWEVDDLGPLVPEWSAASERPHGLQEAVKGDKKAVPTDRSTPTAPIA